MDELSQAAVQPESQELDQNAMQTKKVPADIEDGADITKRRITNDYSSYKSLSTEPGKENIRFLHVLPQKNADDDDEELVCVLSDPIAKTGRIVYIALSYSWGDMSRQRSISLVHHSFDEPDDSIVQEPADGVHAVAVNVTTKKTFNITESLYQTLKSLRKSKAQIEESFPLFDYQPLWVDALCINQSDIEERNSQVGMMRSIYSQAMLVFIWMGEDQDVVRGLHIIVGLVRVMSERFGDDFDILNPKDEQLGTFLSSGGYNFGDENLGPGGCLQVLGRFFNNPYFRRIWVLQEASCNSQSTFIHITNAQVPLSYILVAERCYKLRETLYFTGKPTLPIAWGSILRKQLLHMRDVQHENGEKKPHNRRTCMLLARLFNLFEHTYTDFEATDPRDKLYALLDFALETQNGMGSREELAPDYNKPVSEVFSNFTIWCIRYSGNLDVLGLLASGPRRVLPKDLARFEVNESPTQSYLDARSHPSWAVWPTGGGIWTQGSLAKEPDFDLATQREVRLFQLSTHPMIRLPRELNYRFLSLGGIRIGIVKSVFHTPLKCIQSTEENSLVSKKWETEILEKDMNKDRTMPVMALTHPYNPSVFKGGIPLLWSMISQSQSPAIIIDDEEGGTLSSQEWLGTPEGRYNGKDELMFRDFLETLLLSPIYRGENSLDHQEDSVPDGPWSDKTMATSIAMCWGENDPHFMYPPPRIAEILKGEPFERAVPQPKLFPLQCRGVGKCFFITEDEHMGLCPPDVRSGDIIIALFGSRLPFVVHPVR
ncbi:unnamed protein product [Clonostachys rosea]|uniref:Heterokaryon incompatibility domain-containing protein n=1 Tax=Bionectria ochroleuca TaxID=29856 RepID=A0ABY6UGE6_BIOOC|nr:unnamed protein product [Clonostachys rosea]